MGFLLGRYACCCFVGVVMLVCVCVGELFEGCFLLCFFFFY